MVVAMPGVPREMFRMWREQALPRISSRLTGRVYRSANLRTLGIGESAVSHLLDELTQRPHPYVGTYAKDDGVHVRVTASADDPAEAEAELAETVAEVRRRLADYVYADDDRSLPQVLLDTLRNEGLTIAVAESGTGGRFGSLLLSEPAAAGIVRGTTVIAGDDARSSRASWPPWLASEFGSAIGVGVSATVEPPRKGSSKARSWRPSPTPIPPRKRFPSAPPMARSSAAPPSTPRTSCAAPLQPTSGQEQRIRRSENEPPS